MRLTGAQEFGRNTQNFIGTCQQFRFGPLGIRRKRRGWNVSREGNRAREGSAAPEVAEGAGGPQPEEKEAQGNFPFSTIP